MIVVVVANLVAEGYGGRERGFTPRWHVARGTPLENEHTETYKTFHIEAAWHVAFATCDLHATPRFDFSKFFFFYRATCHL